MAAVEIELWLHPVGLVVEVGCEARCPLWWWPLLCPQHTYSFLLLHLTVSSLVLLLLADT